MTIRADLSRPPYVEVNRRPDYDKDGNKTYFDGLAVTLYLNTQSGNMAIEVEDDRAGDGFAILEIPREDAKHAFEHPMTYSLRPEVGDEQFV